jgi:uroporphyrinogen-III decarboxylase
MGKGGPSHVRRKSDMNSRERVEKAINFQEADRVPIDLGGLKASTMAVETYERLARQLGVGRMPRVADTPGMTAVIEEPVRKRFSVDVMPVDTSMIPGLMAPESEWVPRRLFSGTDVIFPPGTRIQEEADGGWVLLDNNGVPSTFHMPKDGYYFDDMSFNRAEGYDPAKFNPVDDIADEDLKQIEVYSSQVYQGTDYALLGWGGGVCFLGLSVITDPRSNVTMGSTNQWMMMLLTEKETCHEMMGRSVEASIKCLSLLHQAVGDRCFAWGVASDDSGTQRGEFIKPSLWAEMIQPHYRKLCDWVHQNTHWKTFLHSCGSVYYLIPHFIEAGIDILNPVQTSAANMDPAQLKKEYGGKIVFWGGGCDTQSVLGGATPEEVREHVRERLGIFAPGGGYVFTQVHNIQRNVPTENVIAMLDAAREFGVYAKG